MAAVMARRLCFNVGGTRSETTWETLSRHPESMLTAWAQDPSRWQDDPGHSHAGLPNGSDGKHGTSSSSFNDLTR